MVQHHRTSEFYLRNLFPNIDHGFNRGIENTEFTQRLQAFISEL